MMRKIIKYKFLATPFAAALATSMAYVDADTASFNQKEVCMV